MKIPPEKVYPKKETSFCLYSLTCDASQQEHRHPVATRGRFFMPFIAGGCANNRLFESITFRNNLLFITHAENKTPGGPNFDIISMYFPHHRHKQYGIHAANCLADKLRFHFSPRRFP